MLECCRYLEKETSHFPGKLSAWIDPAVSGDVIKTYIKKYIQLRHNEKIDGSHNRLIDNHQAT